MILRICFLEKNPSSFFNSGQIWRRKTLGFWGSEYSPNFRFFGSMFTIRRYIVNVDLSEINKTDEENFPYLHPCELIKNKIIRFHKLIYEELLGEEL